MKQPTIRTTILIMVLILATPIRPSLALDFPQDAFMLMAESSVEPCSVCVEQEHKKAFEKLNAAWVPGMVISSDATCFFVKSKKDELHALTWNCYPPVSWSASLPEGSKLPRVVFRFHTADSHLVGIADKDYTDPKIAETIRSAPLGTGFEGQITLIAYKYGNGPVFNYFQQSNTLQVHCVVKNIKPVKP